MVVTIQFSNSFFIFANNYEFSGKKFLEFSRQDVNDYTNDYLVRDGHERCDDPFVQDKFKALYERLEVEDDDKITDFTILF